MDTKKTILISVATTLITMFVVATLVHLSKGHCGKGNSGCHMKQMSHCNMGSSHCDKSASCASYSKCSKGSSCKKSSSCSGESKCSKSASCSDKSKCSKGKTCSSKTTCTKGEHGETIVKKVIEVEEEK